MVQRSLSLADQIFEKLEKDILAGSYQRGDILTEAKLCEELGVSRTPVREALRNFLTPVITAAALAGLFIVLVLQKFGSRIPDHIVYSLGILIAAGICLYALWHKPEDGIGKTAPSGRVQHGVIMVCICLILYYSSRYMNAISDIDHDVSQSMIIALLCIMMLMMGNEM